jgi:hypothetical protein
MSKHKPGRVKVQHPHAGERGWEVAFEPGLEQLCPKPMLAARMALDWIDAQPAPRMIGAHKVMSALREALAE